MDVTKFGSGYVRVMLECPRDDDSLVEAAKAVLRGENPTDILARYAVARNSSELIIDPQFGAIPIGSGGDRPDISPETLNPEASNLFILRAFIKAEDPGQVPAVTKLGKVHSDPIIGSYLTSTNSRAKGDTVRVREKLGLETLDEYGLDGSGVAIAIVDTGIYLPHLTKRLGAKPALDVENSWTPDTLATRPGMHRVGHGTMCAYDALIAAPKATLLDLPMLLARPLADHSAQATVSAAMQAYWPLINDWVIGPLLQKQAAPYRALVVSNSWGILHPSLDLLPGHPGRFIDNPNHIFRLYIKALAFMGVDVVFAASNCGIECPSAVCLGQSVGMIMGANAYDEVLTLSGCDVGDERVGYSSQGPTITMLNLVARQKPDLTVYTHFLGSKVYRSFAPDTGTSAACAVAAGCIAALRTKASQRTISPAALFQALKTTALKVGGPNWNPGYGHGIIRPVAAARSLGLIP